MFQLRCQSKTCGTFTCPKQPKQENQRSNLKTNKKRRPANRRPGKNKPKNFSRMIKSAEGKQK